VVWQKFINLRSSEWRNVLFSRTAESLTNSLFTFGRIAIKCILVVLQLAYVCAKALNLICVSQFSVLLTYYRQITIKYTWRKNSLASHQRITPLTKVKFKVKLSMSFVVNPWLTVPKINFVQTAKMKEAKAPSWRHILCVIRHIVKDVFVW